MASSKALGTTNEHLPEDVTLQILYGLPVKSLIRFSCTSKRWKSLISDPQFAKNHFKSSLNQRLLLSTPSHLQSFDLQTPSFMDASSVTNLTCPFSQPGRQIVMLGSCNGMVFVTFDSYDEYYIWNPSTGMFLRLPNPCFVSSKVIIECLYHCGFGYVSATDEYKAIVGALFEDDSMALEIFSSRANSWKIMEPPEPSYSDISVTRIVGALSNEALHWVKSGANNPEIIAFDLEREEFREIPLPFFDEERDDIDFSSVGVFFGGCLCVSVFEVLKENRKEVQLWVMMEYGNCKSWSKQFRFSMVYDRYLFEAAVFHTESSVILWRMKSWMDELTRFNLVQKDVVECSGQYMVEKGGCEMIIYFETLLWLDDHLGLEENIKRVGTQQVASTSTNA